MSESTPLPEEITPDEPGPEELAAADQEVREPDPVGGDATAEDTDVPEVQTDPDDGTDSSDVTGAAEDRAEADIDGEAEPDIAATGTIGQLPAEDTLEDRGGRDVLDETITAPDAPGPLYDETVVDETRQGTIDDRIEAEVPEVWEDPDANR